MQRTPWAIVTVLITLSASTPVAAAEDATRPLRDEDIVARVNTTPIYRKSVREVVQGVLREAEKEPSAATVAKLAGDALDSLVDFELLYQESQRRDVRISDAAVDEDLARTRGKFPDARSFDAALKAQGLTADNLRR